MSDPDPIATNIKHPEFDGSVMFTCECDPRHQVEEFKGKHINCNFCGRQFKVSLELTPPPIDNWTDGQPATIIEDTDIMVGSTKSTLNKGQEINLIQDPFGVLADSETYCFLWKTESKPTALVAKVPRKKVKLKDEFPTD